MSVRISPSILAADFTRLADEAAAVADDADLLHVDVMDNHFVPNLTVGLPVVESLVKNVRLPLDIHLGVADPDRWAPGYAEAGARSVTIHAEATITPVRTLRAIRAAGAQAGLALNPATPLEPYEALLAEADTLLVMTVEPGFGSQRFLDFTLEKVRRARRTIDALARFGGRRVPLWLQVDGGVNETTIARCAEAGADSFVAGSAVYAAADPGAAVRALRARAEDARPVTVTAETA
ncbi:ribulose-phosphate 3-epimerase [Streptomyces mashuensis]|uniref:Ribulose-phosphate 3-epimerase n=1 Tax=Streptomyces mashuensis TaxID=33904 RepID=A0A919AVL7_9ACTN|nr:ribulose-phosphate 3-epimerase [Streptomyces mashuensis]GHF28380.1 ribulose-phosphate 3-epimerase [Streptomyces mashuensis]